MTRLVFTWDEAKSRANRRKHGVSFETAARVFDDPFHLSVQDRVEEGEERWQTLGQVGGITVLLVAHTLRLDTLGELVASGDDEPVEEIRIISARKADRRERRRYEERRD